MITERTVKTRKAFTLAETILASVILCAAVVVLCAISSRSLRQTKLSRQHDLARRLLNQQLTMIDHMGIDEFIDQGIMQGEFGEQASGYDWKAELAQQTYENLYKLKLTVSWNSGKQQRSISAMTMLNAQSTATSIIQ